MYILGKDKNWAFSWSLLYVELQTKIAIMGRIHIKYSGKKCFASGPTKPVTVGEDATVQDISAL